MQARTEGELHVFLLAFLFSLSDSSDHVQQTVRLRVCTDVLLSTTAPWSHACLVLAVMHNCAPSQID